MIPYRPPARLVTIIERYPGNPVDAVLTCFGFPEDDEICPEGWDGMGITFVAGGRVFGTRG